MLQRHAHPARLRSRIVQDRAHHLAALVALRHHVARAERLRAVPANVVTLRGATVRRTTPDRCVLVVEDDDAQRVICTDTLAAQLGVPVHAAATLAEAALAVERWVPAVVVLDWYMARDTARSFLVTLRRDVRVVIHSGAVDPEVTRTAAQCQATVVLKGSLEDRALAATVRAEMDAATG